MNNVQIEIKPIQENKEKDIFFPGNYVISKISSAIVKITNDINKNKDCFSGIYINANEIEFGGLQDTHMNNFSKSLFKQFEGEITIKVTAP